MTTPSRRLRAAGDRGAALVSVLLLLVALTAVSSTVAVVATNDTISAGRDRQSAGALATADAGVAQALQYIRTAGIGSITCREDRPAASPDSCAGNTAWSNPTNPMRFRVGGGSTCASSERCFEVWIGVVTAYAPPAVKTGRYRIHSTGRDGSGPGARAVVVDVDVTPARFPIGVFGNSVSGNGGTRLSSEMLFSRACIFPRQTGSGNGVRFTGLDPYWDEPAAAASVTNISTSNNCGASGYVHAAGVPCPAQAALRYDRSGSGGNLPAGSPCATYSKADGTVATRTSTRFTQTMLEQTYGYRPGGLSNAQYEALKVRAQAIGTYNTATSNLNARLAAALASGVVNPVVYYEGSVSLSRNDIPAAFGRTPTQPCSPNSVVVVVRNGDLTYQGGNSEWRSMALFVPNGSFTGNGGYNIMGTLFANNLSLGGNEEFRLDTCFVQNLPGGLLDLDVKSFREDDRRDVG